MYKIRKELVFKIKNNDYTKDKYYLQKEKKTININKINIDKIVLSNKTPYDEQDVNKYYITYLSDGLRPLHIIIKDIKLYTYHMTVLANDNELLKYIEIWNKFEALLNKKGLHSGPVHNNEYTRTKIIPYNEKFRDFEKLAKDKYCGQSILLLESICEVENKHYPQIFLHKFFEWNSVKKHNKNSLFKELVQTVDWYDDDESLQLNAFILCL